MFERLAELDKRYDELEKVLADPETTKNQRKFQELAKEMANITELVKEYREYKKNADDLGTAKEMLETEEDDEMRALYEEELDECSSREEAHKRRLEELLLEGEDTDKDKNTIVEIRAGTGGEEAALFASDLYRMYSRYASERSLRVEVMSTNETGIGGFKEIIFAISGQNAYKYFRFESGTHRVQRVPETETGGRIHTSAVTVAVLPEAEDVDIEVDQNDLRIDVYRSSGPGGQSVNTTDSAVRITHVPTGLVVSCQDEKSQHKNKAKAMRVLRSRLLEKMKAEQSAERASDRKSQVGTGDRSGRIRTYNFPDNRVTDHRINMTLYSLDRILEGDLTELFNALDRDYREKQLAGMSSS